MVNSGYSSAGGNTWVILSGSRFSKHSREKYVQVTVVVEAITSPCLVGTWYQISNKKSASTHTCDPVNLAVAPGYHRTPPRADLYRYALQPDSGSPEDLWWAGAALGIVGCCIFGFQWLVMVNDDGYRWAFTMLDDGEWWFMMVDIMVKQLGIYHQIGW